MSRTEWFKSSFSNGQGGDCPQTRLLPDGRAYQMGYCQGQARPMDNGVGGRGAPDDWPGGLT